MVMVAPSSGQPSHGLAIAPKSSTLRPGPTFALPNLPYPTFLAFLCQNLPTNTYPTFSHFKRAVFAHALKTIREVARIFKEIVWM